jgi:hypothetical protein
LRKRFAHLLSLSLIVEGPRSYASINAFLFLFSNFLSAFFCL